MDRFLPSWTQLPKIERLALAIATLSIFAVVLVFSFWMETGDVFPVIKFSGLGCLLGVLALTGFSLVHQAQARGWKNRAPGWLRRYRYHVLLWIVCSLLLVSLFPKGYRTLMDEIVVLSTSKTIHEEKEALTPMALEFNQGIKKLDAAHVDKRPFLFATLVALLHDVRGYAPENSFYANMLLGVGSLGLAWYLGKKWGGSNAAGAVALLALTSLPIFCQHATGGGIDVINVFMILCLMVACLNYLEGPSNTSCRLLLGTTLLLGYSRYESVVYWIIPALSLAYVYARQKRFFLDPLAAVLPLLAIPLFTLHFLTFSQAQNSFQLQDRSLATAFSLSYVGNNLVHSLNFFLDTQHTMTNSPALFVVGAVACLLLLITVLRQPAAIVRTPTEYSFALFALGSLLAFLLLESYCWGDLDNLIASRLSLPFYLLLILGLARSLHYTQQWRKIAWGLCLLFVGSIYWTSFPIAGKSYNQKLYLVAQKLEHWQAFIRQQPNDRFAVIHSAANFWLTEDVYCLHPLWIASNPRFLKNMLTSGHFQRIYIIDDLTKDEKTGLWSNDEKALKPLPLDLDLVDEIAIGASNKVKIQRILPSSADRLEKAFPAKDAPTAPPTAKDSATVAATTTS